MCSSRWMLLSCQHQHRHNHHHHAMILNDTITLISSAVWNCRCFFFLLPFRNLFARLFIWAIVVFVCSFFGGFCLDSFNKMRKNSNNTNEMKRHRSRRQQTRFISMFATVCYVYIFCDSSPFAPDSEYVCCAVKFLYIRIGYFTCSFFFRFNDVLNYAWMLEKKTEPLCPRQKKSYCHYLHSQKPTQQNSIYHLVLSQNVSGRLFPMITFFVFFCGLFHVFFFLVVSFFPSPCHLMISILSVRPRMHRKEYISFPVCGIHWWCWCK